MKASIKTRINPQLRLLQARRSMDAVLARVPSNAWFDRPVPQRHRLVFYAGHVEAFDWNLIKAHLNISGPYSEFDSLFAFGVDPKNGQLPDDQPSQWPSMQQISEYRTAVRQRIDEVVTDISPFVLHIALEHRLMHVETFAYLLHNLSTPISARPHLSPPAPAPFTQDDAMIAIPSGMVTLGQSRGTSEDSANAHGFGWDNEFDEHRVFVPSFGINRYKVTNRRYLPFVEAGAAPPHFWRRRGSAWYWRTFGGEVPLPLDWPVYVTHQEATAYAAWRGQTLPTEPQFHRAAFGTPTNDERAYPWGNTPPTPSHGNFDGRCWDPIGVACTPLGESAFGVAQLVGNGWEWTSTVFAPFPGFEPYACYPGYSAPFFDSDHFVLKGGSPLTAACFLRRSYRNWFRPDYRFVYASFRCVEN